MVAASTAVKSKKRSDTLPKVALCLALLAAMVVFLFPIYLVITSAFKSKPELAKSILSLPLSFAYLENFGTAMKTINFWVSLRNTIVCTFPSVALVVIASSMGGYSIAKHGQGSRLIKGMDMFYLASMMIPFQVLMIPVYKLYKTMGLQNTHVGMILMLSGTSIAYSTFLYVGFAKTVPQELESAALIDGCGPYRAFFSIIFPLMGPITATVAALHIMWFWNDFNIALILLQRDSIRTLTIKQFYFFGQYRADYGMAFAAALLSMVPVLAFFLLMQRYIVEGVSAGAVKS